MSILAYMEVKYFYSLTFFHIVLVATGELLQNGFVNILELSKRIRLKLCIHKICIHPSYTSCEISSFESGEIVEL